MVAFHCCTRGELMPGSIEPNAPNAMYCVSGPVTIGCGSLPPYGSSSPPGGSGMIERVPNGGAPALVLWDPPGRKAYPLEYEERSAKQPSPLKCHAPPARCGACHDCR